MDQQFSIPETILSRGSQNINGIKTFSSTFDMATGALVIADNVPFLPLCFSKTRIIGGLHPSVPYVVLREIAFEKDIILSLERIKNDVRYWAKMFKKIVNIKPKVITDIKSDRSKIISIVNPFESNWTDESLQKSLEHLVKDHSGDVIQKSCLGLQTKENPESFNACKLYSMCKKRKIQVPLDASIEDMFSFLSDVVPLSDIVPRVPLSDIRSFDIYSEFDNLKKEADLFSEIEYLRKMIQPKTNVQAIVIGALVFNKDYSKYTHPLNEFYHNTKPLMHRNPMYTDLNMYFNPYLPRNAYSEEILEHHISLFSYQDFDFHSLSNYEILQELHLEDNLHLGYHLNIRNTESPIHLDEIDDLKNEKIICFGVRGESLAVTSWRELKDCFENTKMFTNPFEKKRIFSKQQIERLYKLGTWILSPSEKHKYLFETFSPETLSEIKDFLFVVNQIKITDGYNFAFLKDKISIFNSRSPKQKDAILSGLEKLFELTMFMRGWNNMKEDASSLALPIEHSYTTETEESQRRIIECIFELDEINKNTLNFIYSLPLMTWKGVFIQSTTEEQGLIIGDRIDIVKKGETEGVYSCVRMSSNVLGASYCFYCSAFNVNPKFDIFKFSHIQ
jgi:hypothetical protein